MTRLIRMIQKLFKKCVLILSFCVFVSIFFPHPAIQGSSISNFVIRDLDCILATSTESTTTEQVSTEAPTTPPRTIKLSQEKADGMTGIDITRGGITSVNCMLACQSKCPIRVARRRLNCIHQCHLDFLLGKKCVIRVVDWFQINWVLEWVSCFELVLRNSVLEKLVGF